STQRASFSVRRDPSTYSPAAFTELEHLVDIEGVTGSIPVAPTIQSHQTADFQAESKQAVSAGIFAGIVRLFRSPVTLPVSQAEFSLPSPHPKIPFPAVGLRPPRP